MKSAINYEKSTRFLCACLSPGNSAAVLEKEMPCSEAEWVNVLELSNRFLLTPALYVSLRDKGLLDKLDAKLVGFLGEVYQQNNLRNGQLLKQMHRIATMLNQEGIQPVLLKGIGSLAEELFSDQGCRSMLDIDLLVAEEHLLIAADILKSAGYYNFHDHCDLGDHHLPRLFHDDEPAGLEVHRELFFRIPDSVLTASSLIAQSVIATPWEEDATVRLLTVEHQIMHNFLHSQIGDQNFDTYQFDLRQMFHFATLTYHHRDQINWKAIEHEMQVYGDAYQAYVGSINTLFCLDNPTADHSDNAIQYLDSVLQGKGSAMGRSELLKLEWNNFKFAISPTRIRRRFGATTSFELIYYMLKLMVNMINKNIIQGGFKERIRRYHRLRMIRDVDK